ncbi:MAG: cell division protein FtsQ/DivIB [Rhizobiaceae bacterium]|nr:cell division protein FtsQ/DivIB [Rhizobiaceae bacterium]
MSGWFDRARAVTSTAGQSLPANVVLPRLLRRPARYATRVLAGEIEAPRYSATIGTVALLAATGLYGAWLGGHVPAMVQSVTARVGFAIDEVRVVGNHETSEIDILDRLQLDGWTSLIGFDAEAARARIADLPWVSMAAVRKVYPDVIEVRIEERKPFALWQHGREIAIVEESGAVITPFRGGRHQGLPLVIGLGAPERAAPFVNLVKTHPELSARVKGYVRVAERRWDLKLENGVTVKLPESGADVALDDLAVMDTMSGLLSRDILTVDMRLADRLVVQLTPEAVVSREAALKEQAKALKKRGQKI